MSLHALYGALSERWTTERVARALLALDLGLPPRAVHMLQRAAGSKRRWTSMSETFERALAPRAQVAVARGLFPMVPGPRRADDPGALRQYIAALMAALGVTGTHFAHDRPARAHRSGPFRSKRAFNKRIRFLHRFVAKVARFERMATFERLSRVAKTRLAMLIEREAFLADPRTAAFVAWMTARLGRRSVFTCGSQDRAFDQVAAELLRGLGPKAHWFTVAQVHPAPEVLAKLSAQDQGRLLGSWHQVMVQAATVLDGLARTGRYDLERFVVRRGNDSSSWNGAAGAFNKAREGWLNTARALGHGAMLDALLPGKALRLMAADVVAWHRTMKQPLDPDTRVAARLPKPWAVVLGRVPCGRAQVLAACKAEAVTGRGWFEPRRGKVARSTLTRELVHGVEVSSPALAATLRRAGAFAGPSKAGRLRAGRVPAFERVLLGDRVRVEPLDSSTH
jgi:hypothetical protein